MLIEIGMMLGIAFGVFLLATFSQGITKKMKQFADLVDEKKKELRLLDAKITELNKNIKKLRTTMGGE